VKNDSNSSGRIIARSEEAIAPGKRYALKEYLKKMEKAIQEAERQFRSKFDEDLKKVSELTDEHKQSFYEYYAEQYYNYEEFPRILRNSLLVSIISLFEFELDFICKILIQEQGLEENWRDLRGSILDKIKTFCKRVEIDITTNEQAWRELKNLYLVRNCIVHNSGLIKGSKNEKKLRGYTEQKGIISDEDEREIDLTEQFCQEAIEITTSFTDKVWDMVYKLPPRKVIS